MSRLFKILLLFFAVCIPLASLSHAQSSSGRYNIGYENGLFNISAEKASLKQVLVRVAEEADILVRLPKSLHKQITVTLFRATLRKALRRLLRGVDYAFLYRGREISEVYVAPVSSRRTRAGHYRSEQRYSRIRASIRRYERRLISLKNRLARVNENSRQGKIIVRQIRSTEKTLERFQNMLR
jgi:type II secretory pathway component GspD/PulD (secretin)